MLAVDVGCAAALALVFAGCAAADEADTWAGGGGGTGAPEGGVGGAPVGLGGGTIPDGGGGGIFPVHKVSLLFFDVGEFFVIEKLWGAEETYQALRQRLDHLKVLLKAVA